MHLFTILTQSSSAPTSPCTISALTPFLSDISAATLAALASLLIYFPKMFAPSFAKACSVAASRPLELPVMRTLLPLSEITSGRFNLVPFESGEVAQLKRKKGGGYSGIGK